MNQKENIKLATTPTKDLSPINNEHLFKLNFDILIKKTKDELKNIANYLKENTGKKNGKHLNKNDLINIILKNVNYTWLQIEENKNTKKCIKCNIEKPFEGFYKDIKMKDGLKSNCKDCQIKYDIVKNKTLNGCLIRMLSSGKMHSKKRKEKGRIDAGIFDITLSDLEKQWKKQNGKCYYSNIQMNYDKRDWKVSLERLNQCKGYTKDNVVLCCQEFNGCSQWSKEKINEMIKIINEDIIRYTIDHYNCNCYNKNENCIKHFFNKLIYNAKKRTKKRIKTKNIKRDNSFNINFNYLIELYNKQRGLCAYSKLPLQFGNYLEKNWICSLERKNVLKGYVKGNVCLICYEFNTSDKTGIYKYEEKGNAGWTREKFKYFLNCI